MKRFVLVALLAAVTLSSRAATFTVTNLDNGGVGSLRDAIAQANASPGVDVIAFSISGTIVLTSGQIVVTEALAISGPGASTLSIDGNGNDRIFAITDNPEQPCPGTTGPSDFVVTITGLTLVNGRRTLSNAGGALLSTKSLTLRDLVIAGSTARRGGGLAFLTQYTGQTLTMNNVRVIDNKAEPRPGLTENSVGGGVYVAPLCGPGSTATQSTIDIQSSLIAGNSSSASDSFQAYAGGLYLVAPEAGSVVRIVDSRIVGNTVVLPATLGSVTYNAGGVGASVRSMLIQGSEIAGNAANAGGGVEFYNVDAALQGEGQRMALTVVNSTISGNAAHLTGAGIQLVSNVAGFFYNDTFADNTAQPSRAGAIRLVANAGQAFPTLALESTIAANSGASVDIGIGGIIPVPYAIQANRSLIRTLDANSTISGAANLIGTDPALGPLAFNGGTTRTQALLAGSPAIDAGSNPLGLPTDQRGAGFPRANDGAVDIGAYEFAAAPPPPVTNQPIPTLSEYALALLALLMAGLGSLAVRRRR